MAGKNLSDPFGWVTRPLTEDDRQRVIALLKAGAGIHEAACMAAVPQPYAKGIARLERFRNPSFHWHRKPAVGPPSPELEPIRKRLGDERFTDLRQSVCRWGAYTVGLYCRVSRHTAHMVQQERWTLCPCGKPPMHRGWCEWRARNSEKPRHYAKRYPDAQHAKRYRAAVEKRNLYLWRYKEPERIAAAIRREARRAEKERLRLAREARRATILPEYWPFSSHDELLRRINEVVPKGIMEDLRAEICQEMAVAVLTGDLLIEDLAGRWREFSGKVRATYGAYKTVSLDAPRPGDESGRPLIEYVSLLSSAWKGERSGITFRDRNGILVTAEGEPTEIELPPDDDAPWKRPHHYVAPISKRSERGRVIRHHRLKRTADGMSSGVPRAPLSSFTTPAGEPTSD